MSKSREKKIIPKTKALQDLRTELKSIVSIDETIAEFQEHRAEHCDKMRALIRRARSESKVSTGEIAAELGITQGHYADIERGRRSSTPDFIEKLSDWVRVAYKV